MAWLRRRKTYDRQRLLRQAARVRRRNPKKAIAALREVLAHEPANAELHRRIAPLLGATGEHAAAWSSYRAAVGNLQRGGFLDQAVGVLREAAGTLRRERELWERLAEVELERGRPVDAHAALLEGRRAFRGRRQREHALALLLRARELAPDHFEANHDLARLLARMGQRARADRVLESLVLRATPRELRRARWRQLRLAPSGPRLWRWLRALTGRR